MLSIIIPTWNEEAALPATLAALQAETGCFEIIVVDSGSADQTCSIARQHGCEVIVSARRQRAAQLNLGAARAQGEVLWFVHADMWIPPGSLARIEHAVRQADVVGGGFARRFRSVSPFLRATCLLACLRSRWLGLYFGDQALYVRTAIFRQVGGFAELPVFEDFDLCRRLQSIGKLRLLAPPIRTSARRFAKRGALLVTAHDLWLTCRYLAGAKAQDLKSVIRPEEPRSW